MSKYIKVKAEVTLQKMAEKECPKIGPSTEIILSWQELLEPTLPELWTFVVSTRVLNEERH